MIGNIHFWLATLLIISIIIMPFYISRIIDFLFSNDIVNNIIQDKYEYDLAKKRYYKKLDGVINCMNSIAKFKKLYKMDKDFEVDNYADKKMKEIVDLFKSKYRNSKGDNIIVQENVKNMEENLFKPERSLPAKSNNHETMVLYPEVALVKNIPNILEEEKVNTPMIISGEINQVLKNDKMSL